MRERTHDEATTTDALFFWQRHSLTPDVIAGYDLSATEPHRDWVLQGLQELGQVRTVLEVGCGTGALLGRLETAGYSAYGMDVNEQALLYADQAGRKVGLGMAPDFFGRCPDRTFHAIVTSFALAYTDPLDLPFTLSEMLRASLRGVVLAEPMAGAGVDERADRNGSYVEWRHDYLDALEAAVALLARPQPLLEMRRLARGPHNGINGLVVGKLTWP